MLSELFCDGMVVTTPDVTGITESLVTRSHVIIGELLLDSAEQEN